MKTKPALLTVGAMLSLFSTIAVARTLPFNVVYNCTGVRSVVNSCLGEADDANCWITIQRDRAGQSPSIVKSADPPRASGHADPVMVAGEPAGVANRPGKDSSG